MPAEHFTTGIPLRFLELHNVRMRGQSIWTADCEVKLWTKLWTKLSLDTVSHESKVFLLEKVFYTLFGVPLVQINAHPIRTTVHLLHDQAPHLRTPRKPCLAFPTERKKRPASVVLKI